MSRGELRVLPTQSCCRWTQSGGINFLREIPAIPRSGAKPTGKYFCYSVFCTLFSSIHNSQGTEGTLDRTPHRGPSQIKHTPFSPRQGSSKQDFGKKKPQEQLGRAVVVHLHIGICKSAVFLIHWHWPCCRWQQHSSALPAHSATKKDANWICRRLLQNPEVAGIDIKNQELSPRLPWAPRPQLTAG